MFRAILLKKHYQSLVDRATQLGYQALKGDSPASAQTEAQWNDVLTGRYHTVFSGEYEFLNHGIAEPFNVNVDDGSKTLQAWRFSETIGIPTAKKTAIVCINGNGEFVSAGFASKKFQNLHKDNNYVDVICQDYRGRGFNREEGKFFYDYPVAQDVEDQKQLIRTLVGKGYKEIVVIGHSYGSQVAIWAVAELQKEDDMFNDIVLISSRGFSDLTAHPAVVGFLGHAPVADRFIQDGMMPETALTTLIQQIPRAFTFQAENDGVIPRSISLAHALNKNGAGNIWTLTANNPKEMMHNHPFEDLLIDGLPEVSANDFIKAIVAHQPIRLDPKAASLKVLTDKISDYEKIRSKEPDGKGKYKKEEKLAMVDQLVDMLKKGEFDALLKLSKEKNALTEGRLGKLFLSEIVPYCKAGQKLQGFNQWVLDQKKLDKRQDSPRFFDKTAKQPTSSSSPAPESKNKPKK